MPDPTESGNSTATTQTALYDSILDWLLVPLSGAGYHRPFVKRVAVLISGLLEANTASRGDIATAVAGLKVSEARPESIARRIGRLLDDPAADPQRLLPAICTPQLLATLLQDELRAHAANVRSGVFHHERFRPLCLIVDLTAKKDQVALLVVGLAYRGIVLPLAVRTWLQNTALVEGTY